jgi:hypothetical protein
MRDITVPLGLEGINTSLAEKKRSSDKFYGILVLFSILTLPFGLSDEIRLQFIVSSH